MVIFQMLRMPESKEGHCDYEHLPNTNQVCCRFFTPCFGLNSQKENRNALFNLM